MKRVEKFELPFAKSNTKLTIKGPDNEGKIEIEYDIPNDSYKVLDKILIPGKYYKLKEENFDYGDNFWYILFNSMNGNKLIVDFDLVIWGYLDYENTELNEYKLIDDIDLKTSYWGNIEDIAFIDDCDELEIKACEYLKKKYENSKNNYGYNDFKESWIKIIDEVKRGI